MRLLAVHAARALPTDGEPPGADGGRRLAKTAKKRWAALYVLGDRGRIFLGPTPETECERSREVDLRLVLEARALSHERARGSVPAIAGTGR